MARHFTADPHWFHKNKQGTGIIDYCGRPFKNLDEMHESMIELWNGVVKPGDEVWVDGDWTFGKFGPAYELTQRLNGTKFLLIGNHDKFTTTKYKEMGFSQVIRGAHVLELKNGKKVILNHYPEYPDWYLNMNPVFRKTGKEFFDQKIQDKADWLFCGHSHHHWRSKVDKVWYRRIINVGVDVWNFTPVSEERLIAFMEYLENGGIDSYKPPDTVDVRRNG